MVVAVALVALSRRMRRAARESSRPDRRRRRRPSPTSPRRRGPRTSTTSSSRYTHASHPVGQPRPPRGVAQRGAAAAPSRAARAHLARSDGRQRDLCRGARRWGSTSRSGAGSSRTCHRPGHAGHPLWRRTAVPGCDRRRRPRPRGLVEAAHHALGPDRDLAILGTSRGAAISALRGTGGTTEPLVLLSGLYEGVEHHRRSAARRGRRRGTGCDDRCAGAAAARHRRRCCAGGAGRAPRCRPPLHERDVGALLRRRRAQPARTPGGEGRHHGAPVRLPLPPLRLCPGG